MDIDEPVDCSSIYFLSSDCSSQNQCQTDCEEQVSGVVCPVAGSVYVTPVCRQMCVPCEKGTTCDKVTCPGVTPDPNIGCGRLSEPYSPLSMLMTLGIEQFYSQPDCSLAPHCEWHPEVEACFVC